MLMHFAKKRSIAVGKTLVQIAEGANKSIAKTYAAKSKAAMALTARDWRAWAKAKLSGPCSQKDGMSNNTTTYPGRCSGDLQRSLGYRTFVKVTKIFGGHVVSAGAAAEFIPFTKRGFDYGSYHDENTNSKLYGYKDRVYQELNSRIHKHLEFRPGLQFGLE